MLTPVVSKLTVWSNSLGQHMSHSFRGTEFIFPTRELGVLKTGEWMCHSPHPPSQKHAKPSTMFAPVVSVT